MTSFKALCCSKSAEMTELSSTPTALSAIETCWQTIEAFSDLESSVAIAQTCHSLHRTIVDTSSNKLKVSHFEVDNFPSLSSNETPAKNWHTAPARIPHFLSRALNAIHFQSLRKLHLDFPQTKRRIASGHADIIDDACMTSFPIFVTNLSSASNLNSLYLHAGRLMAIERSGQLEALYEIFGDNLVRRCRKLRDLEVNNSGVVRGIDDRLYSVALTRALIPTIRQVNLQRLKLIIAGRPSDPLYERLLSSKGIDVVSDIFEAALSVATLSALELAMLSISHLNALVNAALRLLSGESRPLFLKKLMLGCSHTTPALVDALPVAPLLDYFSKCNYIESIHLILPPEYWVVDENILSLRSLLDNKTCLLDLKLSFTGCRSDGKIMKVISDCLATNRSLRKLWFTDLRDVDREDALRLQNSLQEMGFLCTTFEAFQGVQRLDIRNMVNQRLVNAEAVEDAFVKFIDW